MEAEPADPRGAAGVESLDMMEEWLEFPSKYEVEYMKKISSRESDFSPTYANDNFNELIFTSTREGSTGKKTEESTDISDVDVNMPAVPASGKTLVSSLLYTATRWLVYIQYYLNNL